MKLLGRFTRITRPLTGLGSPGDSLRPGDEPAVDARRLPAAFSTAIGAQTQRPLAIVVVGGMLTTLFLTRYLMPVFYSFYGHREPPVGGSSRAH